MPFAMSERLRFKVAIRLANKLLAEAGVINSRKAEVDK
jgi:hypothetical protein